MPEFQLPIALALTAVLAASLGARVFIGREKKKDALPVFSEDQEGLTRDPFDVATPEDFVDGTPLDEDAFWTRVRRYTILVSHIPQASRLDAATQTPHIGHIRHHPHIAMC